MTPTCVVAASEIIENMSPRYKEIDPCTDFEAFVCEGWSEKHDLRADQGSSFTGTVMAENAQQILRHLLEHPYPVNNEAIEVHSNDKSEIFGKLQDAYNACMNEEQIKTVGSSPLLVILRHIEGLFPAGKYEQIPNSFPKLPNQGQRGLSFKGENQLSRTMAYLTSIGVDALVSLGVGV